MTVGPARYRSWIVWVTAAVAGMTAFVLSASCINHGLRDSPLPPGPGLTVDESINVRQGQFLFDAFCRYGPLMMLPDTAPEVYSDPAYLPDHVPLARFAIGAAHGLASWLISGAEDSVANIPAARLASSIGLAMTVCLLVAFAGRRFGIGTAVCSAVLLLGMPRVVGHSRIAALETLTTLAWFAALLPLLAWWTNVRTPTMRQSMLSGFLWGVLLLTKIQAILLPPVIIIWVLLRFGRQGFGPLLLWGVTGITVFCCGWPWLWLDPLENASNYFLRTAERPTVYCWYLSERFADKSVPWHFPFVMTVVTVPLAVTVCGAVRCVQKTRDRVDLLLILSVALPLAVFALPGTPVYDGTRLFLFVMPALALLAGRGLSDLLESVKSWQSGEYAALKRVAGCVLLVLLTAEFTDSALNIGPFAADGYNGLVRRTNELSPLFESCYWGDALNGEFWRQVPEDSTVFVAPVLHSLRLPHMQAMIPVIQHRRLRLEPYLYDPHQQRGLVLLIYRLADLRPDLWEVPAGALVIAEVRLRDTILARLIDTTHATWHEVREW